MYSIDWNNRHRLDIRSITAEFKHNEIPRSSHVWTWPAPCSLSWHPWSLNFIVWSLIFTARTKPRPLKPTRKHYVCVLKFESVREVFKPEPGFNETAYRRTGIQREARVDGRTVGEPSYKKTRRTKDGSMKPRSTPYICVDILLRKFTRPPYNYGHSLTPTRERI